MVQQVNIDGIGVSQRLQQVVTGGVFLLDKFDTGKVLILSSSTGLPGVVDGIALPSASAVEPGFFATVLVGDSNFIQWAVQRAGPDGVPVGQEVSGNWAQGPGVIPAFGPFVITGEFGAGAGTTSGATISAFGPHTPGARLEIYCDGVTWYLEGFGNVARVNDAVNSGWMGF